MINQNLSASPCVSIIVPVFNTERYLRQCLDSLVNQTLKNIEVVIVDDGSTDNCPAMCDAYAEQDTRVRVIHQQNRGYGKACNVGLNAAGGEYIGIVEADDFAALNMFERLYNQARANNLDAARCHFYYYYSHTNKHERSDLSDVPQNMVFSPRENYTVFFKIPTVWAQIYKADFLKENNIVFNETPGASYQDASFNFKVNACANRFMLIEDAFIYYRQHDESSSRSKTKVYCVCDESVEIESFAREKGLYDELKPVIAKLKYGRYWWNYRRLDKKSGWPFLKVFSKEMREHIAKKEIEKSLYPRRDIIKIYVIAFFYPAFHFGSILLGK